MLRQRSWLGSAMILAALAVLLATSPSSAQVYGTISGGGVVTSPRGTLFQSHGAGITPRGTVFRAGEAVTTPRGTVFRAETSPAYYQLAPTSITYAPGPAETPSNAAPLAFPLGYTTSYETSAGFPASTNAAPVVGPPPATESAAGVALPVARGTAALIDVRLPAVGELRFEGVRMNQIGTLGRFVSPPLVPGQTYRYEVSATWMQNGRPVTQNGHVMIRAGDRITVDFLPTAGEQATSTVRTGLVP